MTRLLFAKLHSVVHLVPDQKRRTLCGRLIDFSREIVEQVQRGDRICERCRYRAHYRLGPKSWHEEAPRIDHESRLQALAKRAESEAEDKTLLEKAQKALAPVDESAVRAKAEHGLGGFAGRGRRGVLGRFLGDKND